MDVCARNVRERTNLKSVLDGELALGSLGGGLNLDGGIDLNFIRSVRHPRRDVSLHTAENRGDSHFWFLKIQQGVMSSSAFVDVREK